MDHPITPTGARQIGPRSELILGKSEPEESTVSLAHESQGQAFSWCQTKGKEIGKWKSFSIVVVPFNVTDHTVSGLKSNVLRAFFPLLP